METELLKGSGWVILTREDGVTIVQLLPRKASDGGPVSVIYIEHLNELARAATEAADVYNGTNTRQPATEQAKPCEHVRQIRVVADEVGAQLSTINFPVIGAWCADCGALMLKVDDVWSWRLPQAPVRTTEQAIADWLERRAAEEIEPPTVSLIRGYARAIRSGKWREGAK